MNTYKYAYSYDIEIEITDDLKERLQNAVYRIRNSDLDQRVDIDGLEQMAFEIDNELSDYAADEIESVEYTRINKDTDMNEIVKLDVEVIEFEEDESYKIVVKSMRRWNEAI